MLIGSFLESREIEKRNDEIRQENENNRRAVEERNRQLDIRVKEQNQQECARIVQNEEIRKQKAKQWQERKAYLNKEYKKVSDLIDKSYSLNILASPYRNLHSLHYIYDYMSTSHATFKETLYHEHLENGFQRVLQGIDTIVRNQHQQIYQLRQIEASNRANASRTLDMLERMGEQARLNFNRMGSQLGGIHSTLGSIDSNARIASDYARIAANYSAANAYFSLANYLKD